jgi:hypothetical protein
VARLQLMQATGASAVLIFGPSFDVRCRLMREFGASFPRTTDPLVSCPMGLYWLTYKRNGRLAGVAILSADSLMAARMHASAHGISKGAMFEQGHMLDAQIAMQLPRNLVGRMLERREAVELLAQIERGVGNVL